MTLYSVRIVSIATGDSVLAEDYLVPPSPSDYPWDARQVWSRGQVIAVESRMSDGSDRSCVIIMGWDNRGPRVVRDHLVRLVDHCHAET